MIDYTQSGEQRVIIDCFRGKPCHWLSLGENDGTTYSNVRALSLLGHPGVAVEPAAPAFAKLLNLYRPEGRPPLLLNEGVYRCDNIICVNAAITNRDGPVDFYDSGTHLHKGDTSLLATTRPEEMKRWKKSGETFTKTTVRGITFKTLLKETGKSAFDFVSIDCEGVDFDILKQMDLAALGVKMLCVETNSVENEKYIAYCAKFGMKLVHRNHENCIFSHGH